MCAYGNRVKEEPCKMYTLSKQTIFNLGKQSEVAAPPLPPGLLLGAEATWATLSFTESFPCYFCIE